MGKIRRYWTQFGYTKEQAGLGKDFEEHSETRTAPWTSMTKYYMEHIADAYASTIFPKHKSYFYMVCTLHKCNYYNFKHDFARTHYLGFYFDYELK
jgi:hypothetical protein